MDNIQLNANTEPAISSDGEFVRSANAIMLQNAGDRNILINGHWTIFPKSGIMLGSQTDTNDISTVRWSIKFDTTVGTVSRLEVMIINKC
jgi:hypothetical protein